MASDVPSRSLFADTGLENVPENCGVEFDGKCDTEEAPPVSPVPEEEECEENDEECILRMKGEAPVKEPPPLPQIRKLSLSTKSGTILPGLIPEPPYEGLPKDYYKKKYRPDYPSELKMTTECKTKPLTKRSTGTSRTHPKAKFVPSESGFLGGKQIDPAISAIMEEPSPLEMNRMPPPIVSSSDEVIVDWLEDHNVQMMLEYFLGLCVVHKPDDPWQFISQLCGKMIEARKSIEAFEQVPRLLAPEHTEAVFRIYDRIENGYISAAQYKSAMEAMGLRTFCLTPEGIEKNEISKDTFVKEATDAINLLLKSFMLYDDVSIEDINPQKSVSVGVPTGSFRKSGSYGTGTEASSREYSDEGENEDEGEEDEEDDYNGSTGNTNYNYYG